MITYEKMSLCGVEKDFYSINSFKNRHFNKKKDLKRSFEVFILYPISTV